MHSILLVLVLLYLRVHSALVQYSIQKRKSIESSFSHCDTVVRVVLSHVPGLKIRTIYAYQNLTTSSLPLPPLVSWTTEQKLLFSRNVGIFEDGCKNT